MINKNARDVLDRVIVKSLKETFVMLALEQAFNLSLATPVKVMDSSKKKCNFWLRFQGA